MLETNNLPAAVQAIVERYWERLLDAEQGGAGQVGIEEQKLSALVAADPVFASELCRVWSASDYAANLCIQQPQMVVALKSSGELERSHKNDFAEELASRLESLASVPEPEQDAQLKHLLRRNHQRQMLRIIWRDVCAKATVAEICADISALADAALDLMGELSVDFLQEPSPAECPDVGI